MIRAEGGPSRNSPIGPIHTVRAVSRHNRGGGQPQTLEDKMADTLIDENT